MNLLHLSERSKPSINWVQCRMPQNEESKVIREGLGFIDYICNKKPDLFQDSRGYHKWLDHETCIYKHGVASY